ncbi:MAG TPA: hypothetical protein V6D15_25200 [Oculatellaceae cyanobacterium]|jgi:hypothetical protein
MRLILGILIASIGLSALPVKAQVADAQVGALVEALRQAAPKTGKVDDGLYSDWQIKPANIPRWSKRCIGREMTIPEFESNTATARQVLVCVMRNIMQEEYKASGNNESLAVRRAASWWMTGNPSLYNSGTTNTYTQKVLDFYQKQRSGVTITASTSTSTSNNTKPATQVRPPQPPAPRVAASSVQVADAQVSALVEALRLAAPKTGNENDGLYSDWQVMPDNIPRWSQQCSGRALTPSQFASSPVTARYILVCVMRDVLRDEYRISDKNESLAVKRAAAWWMTGDPSRYSSKETAPYTEKVLAFYQDVRSGKPAQPVQPAQPAQPKFLPHI